MKILIVDDSNKKIAGIVKVIKEATDNEIAVETVLDSVSAQKKLSETNYDLLVIDLLLPVRSGQEPIKEGGKQLVLEIERKDELKSPKYIVGTSQYKDYLTLFPDIWNTLHYDNSTEWKKKLRRVISHLEKVDFNISERYPELPSIIVEGLTDKKVFEESIKLFKPELVDKIKVKADSNAGAKWVSNQIVAWAHSKVGGSNENIRAIGILDGDKAGNEAKEQVSHQIDTNSAKRKFYKLITLSPDYARNLIPIYAKGLIIPVTLEELFPPFVWAVAKDNGWLEERPFNKMLLEEPTKWNQRKQSLDEYISTLDLNEEDKLYLKTVKRGSKKNFNEFVLNLKSKKKKLALGNLKKLLDDIELFLFNNS
ncbi:hypothetical protein [Fodinibius sediminis]|uniref:hypothetical protein n=1 Tax=Fodinibius sediminis TaxID=1214077 RepID=UPI00163DABED|nr:hypothetical protein [Fodinibius sediminis]